MVDGQLILIMCTNPPVPESFLELRQCSCRGPCDTKRCGHKNMMLYVQMPVNDPMGVKTVNIDVELEDELPCKLSGTYMDQQTLIYSEVLM